MFRTFWAIPVNGQKQELDPVKSRTAKDAAQEMKKKFQSRSSHGDESIRDLNSSFSNLSFTPGSAYTGNRASTPLSTHSLRPGVAEFQTSWNHFKTHNPRYDFLELNLSTVGANTMAIVASYVFGDQNESRQVLSHLSDYAARNPRVLAQQRISADTIARRLGSGNWQDASFWDLCAATFGRDFRLLGYPSGGESSTSLGSGDDCYYVFHCRGHFAALRYVTFSMVCFSDL